MADCLGWDDMVPFWFVLATNAVVMLIGIMFGQWVERHRVAQRIADRMIQRWERRKG